MFKYRVVLEDGKTWLLYLSPNGGGELNLQWISNSRIEATSAFNGTVQVARTPSGSAEEEAIFDASAGVYVTGVNMSGFTAGTTGSYTFTFTKAGDTSRQPLMFALPHHVESFDNDTSRARTTVQLQTTTKGVATAVRRDSWTMTEPNLPTDIGFDPWNPENRGQVTLSPVAIQAVNQAGDREVAEDFNARTNLDSMYFSGKGLSKYATLVYTLNNLARNPSRAQEGLNKLKAAFAVFAENRQKFPLVYESAWKGVVSTASYATGDAGVDFGNSYYNDHHFHFGYFIHAAAIIGYLDRNWLAANRDWVNMLVRDAANPSEQDPYFPVFRAFDWYHGHSWAKGLFPSADGKDEESSSEDAFFAYALKMWGRTSGDIYMEARGNLMLAVLARSLRNYFLLESSNRNHPSNFIANKVTGILFENKVDHVTYFGTNIEFIQGIHMIPINPSSAYTRNRNFVSEEWRTFFDQGRADRAVGGWRGLLYANLAIIDPISSWKFFSQNNFDNAWLDDGTTRAWYLAYAAGMAGNRPLEEL
jgi:endo-1,3(4)-beta-glucanase